MLPSPTCAEGPAGHAPIDGGEKWERKKNKGKGRKEGKESENAMKKYLEGEEKWWRREQEERCGNYLEKNLERSILDNLEKSS